MAVRGRGVTAYHVPHRRYADADSALHRYLSLREQATRLRAQAPLGRGLVYGDRCAGAPKCRSLETEETHEVVRCKRCKRPWPQYMAEVPGMGGSSPAGVASAMHGRLAELAWLRSLIERRPEGAGGMRDRLWRLHLAVWIDHAMGAAFDVLGGRYRRELHRAGCGSSGRTVERMVEAARNTIEERLDRAGTLGFGG